jgi:alkylhydroperoxidase family enzyme
MISAWRDAPNLYSSRERAALTWAEAVTRIVDHHVPDAVYEQARAEFSEAELAELTLAVISLNGWNGPAPLWWTGESLGSRCWL